MQGEADRQGQVVLGLVAAFAMGAIPCITGSLTRLQAEGSQWGREDQ